MAYIHNYTYDIFISYAHLDNEKLSGQTIGWIEQFYTDLNILLSRRTGRPGLVKIWWDRKKLDGSVLFDHSIEEGIRQSAIMLCLLSPGYLGSAYCRKELELFHRKAQREPAGLKISDRSRVLNVLLNNIPYTQWPAELSGTSGFPFHAETDSDDLGDPLDTGIPRFKTQLQCLRDAIIRLFHDFPKEEQPAPLPEAEEKKEEKFTIFFGDVSDSLRSVRKRTISELEKKGYQIICDVPPPFEAAAHELAVKEKLEVSNLSVHLLDQYPGREIDNAGSIWYPQQQAALAMKHAASQLIWVPAELDVAGVEEEPYKTFLDGLENGQQTGKGLEYIRGSRSTLTREITDVAEQLKTRQQQTSTGTMSVLLDTHYSDQLYALELSKSLLENRIQPFINPQEDDPRKNMHILGERIKQVNKLVFFYGKVSRDWVLERMSAALQLIVTNNYAVEEFFIFMVPPHKEPDDISLKQRFLKVNVINNSDASQLNPQAIHHFLKSLQL